MPVYQGFSENPSTFKIRSAFFTIITFFIYYIFFLLNNWSNLLNVECWRISQKIKVLQGVQGLQHHSTYIEGRCSNPYWRSTCSGVPGVPLLQLLTSQRQRFQEATVLRVNIKGSERNIRIFLCKRVQPVFLNQISPAKRTRFIFHRASLPFL